MDRDKLTEQFNEAAEYRDPPPGISAAHEPGPDGPGGLDGTALGDAPLVKKEFNEAARDVEVREYEQAPPEHQPEPAPELHPPGHDPKGHAEHQAEMNDFYDQAAEDLKNRHDEAERAKLNDGMENDGLDEGMDQD